jgi:hypothetical protein
MGFSSRTVAATAIYLVLSFIAARAFVSPSRNKVITPLPSPSRLFIASTFSHLNEQGPPSFNVEEVKYYKNHQWRVQSMGHERKRESSWTIMEKRGLVGGLLNEALSLAETRLNQEMDKYRAMEVSELKDDLKDRGILTHNFFDKSEFVVAVAEALVDGVNGRIVEPVPERRPAMTEEERIREAEKEFFSENYAEYHDVEVLTEDELGPIPTESDKEEAAAQAAKTTGNGSESNPFVCDDPNDNPFASGGYYHMMGGIFGIADMLNRRHAGMDGDDFVNPFAAQPPPKNGANGTAKPPPKSADPFASTNKKYARANGHADPHSSSSGGHAQANGHARAHSGSHAKANGRADPYSRTNENHAQANSQPKADPFAGTTGSDSRANGRPDPFARTTAEYVRAKGGATPFTDTYARARGNANPYTSAQGGPRRANGGADPPFASERGNPFSGMGGDVVAKAQQMLQNPKFRAFMDRAQSNPKLMKAVMDCMRNPAAAGKYMYDDEIGDLVRELRSYMSVGPNGSFL